MRVAICDDEKICIDDIVSHIDIFSSESGIEFDKYIFSSADEMLKTDMNYDIAILDVEMDGTDGIKLGEHLRQVNPHIILMYVTAHRKYLDDALNLNAVRFFEKPIDKDRFFSGMDNALERIDNTTINFFIRDDKTQVRVTAESIVYIEISHRKTKVVTEDKAYFTTHTLDYFKDRLVSSIFAQPHKSYIINFNFITAYERGKIVLDGQYKIPVSRSKQTEFHKSFVRFMGGK